MPTTLTTETSATSPPGEGVRAPRRFDFGSDTFAFANELNSGKSIRHGHGQNNVPPARTQTALCASLFRADTGGAAVLYHARFDANQPVVDDETCRRLIREVVSRNPRTPCAPGQETVFPGYANLREFSTARERLLKAECGGAWRSYVLRSHWRMIFPISRAHQELTAARLLPALRRNFSPIIHLVRFPSLTINHGMILFDAAETATGVVFSAYDPNDPARPARLTFDRATKTFSLPQNRYWAGGELNVIEIYRGWFL